MNVIESFVLDASDVTVCARSANSKLLGFFYYRVTLIIFYRSFYALVSYVLLSLNARTANAHMQRN